MKIDLIKKHSADGTATIFYYVNGSCEKSWPESDEHKANEHFQLVKQKLQGGLPKPDQVLKTFSTKTI